MANKVLFCATVDYHFEKFHLPYLQWFKEQGWEVHVAASGDLALPYVDKKYNIPIQRSPFRLKNISAYRALKSIIDMNKYNIIHCHTPMGGVLARLAARQARKQGTHVLYTAHGFHFFKGAPLLNWMIYYPIERWLARYTDCLITINEEDYRLALAHRFKAKRIERVHGVGVDTEKYRAVSRTRRNELRKVHGHPENTLMMFYAAEFNRNKNQQILIRSLALLKNELPEVKLLLAGDGPLLETCQLLAADLGVDHLVEFLGYRNDIEMLLPMCDIAVASSSREGLPVNIVEAMACGLPVIASKNRGHSELVTDYINGFVIEEPNISEYCRRIKELYFSADLRNFLAMFSVWQAKRYSLSKVSLELEAIYSQFAMADLNEADGSIVVPIYR